MKRPGSRIIVFGLAVAALILAGVLLAVARKGMPFGSVPGSLSRYSFAMKLLFVVGIAFLGAVQNRATQKKGL